MKYFFIAGEASGDTHAAKLIKHIFLHDKTAHIQAWGGDEMEKAGASILKHIRHLAFMGFVEVIKHLPEILRNFKLCKKQIMHFQPDTIVLIDYPGFNLRMAKWLKYRGFKVVYYISPTVWAWKENRVEIIRKYVDKLICILPFEKDFYQKKGIDVSYFGNPSAETILQKKETIEKLPYDNIIALLPGSRKQEIKKMLPLMIKTAQHFPQYTFIIAQAPNLSHELYTPYISNQVKLLNNKTHEIVLTAKAAIVTSGTATLETALIGTPQMVVYIAHPISYAIAKRLIKVKYISLVNLILNKAAVKELIQHEANVENMKNTLLELLNNEKVKVQIHEDYLQLQNLLNKGNAIENAAQVILEIANKNNIHNDRQ